MLVAVAVRVGVSVGVSVGVTVGVLVTVAVGVKVEHVAPPEHAALRTGTHGKPQPVGPPTHIASGH